MVIVWDPLLRAQKTTLATNKQHLKENYKGCLDKDKICFTEGELKLLFEGIQFISSISVNYSKR